MKTLKDTISFRWKPYYIYTQSKEGGLLRKLNALRSMYKNSGLCLHMGSNYVTLPLDLLCIVLQGTTQLEASRHDVTIANQLRLPARGCPRLQPRPDHLYLGVSQLYTCFPVYLCLYRRLLLLVIRPHNVTRLLQLASFPCYSYSKTQ